MHSNTSPSEKGNKHARRIYALKGLSPEVKAVTFAKCSRSPEPFDVIAGELSADKSRQFHEKWVVGYGHSSVAEHATLSLAIENVSILATKVIEDNRLASYTEKSTRYQVYDRDKFYKPARIYNSVKKEIYDSTIKYLFDTYIDLYPKVRELVKSERPQEANEPDAMYKSIIKSTTCDIVRYILPVATLTNLGMTINARALEYGIKKMLSSTISEIIEIGEELKIKGQEVTPTLIKYADANPYMIETNTYFTTNHSNMLSASDLTDDTSVKLIDYDKNAENKIIASTLYKYSNKSYSEILSEVVLLPKNKKRIIIDEMLSRQGKFDQPPRELEHVYYTFDVLIDYGAFRDIQRHRMATQTNQQLTTAYKYSIPQKIIEYGFKDVYESCMKKAKEAYDQLVIEFPDEAQYVLPLAYKKRVLFTWNLRELFHFIKLRSSKQGHDSYRRIAGKIYDEVNRVHPMFAKYIKVDKS